MSERTEKLSRSSPDDMAVRRYEGSGGAVVYRVPAMAFPGHVTNCWLVMTDTPTLLDVGSGMDLSNKSLEASIAEVAARHEPGLKLEDVGRVILTHGHIDHFGGLNFLIERARPRVGVHVLDASTILHFEERLIVSSRNLQVFLRRAGLDEETTRLWVERNKWSKNLFKATTVDFTFDDEETIEGGFRVYHAPGHCPGQVCLGLDDLLFTADHVLSRTTPNQSPESIVRYNGLGHYYEALCRVRKLEGYRIGLAGHEPEIEDVPGRIDDMLAFHDRRLDRTLELCAEPKSIREIALGMFPNARDYHVLLALIEAGAHVEYLHERGRLVVTNVEEVERAADPVLLYRRV